MFLGTRSGLSWLRADVTWPVSVTSSCICALWVSVLFCRKCRTIRVSFVWFVTMGVPRHRQRVRWWRRRPVSMSSCDHSSQSCVELCHACETRDLSPLDAARCNGVRDHGWQKAEEAVGGRNQGYVSRQYEGCPEGSCQWAGGLRRDGGVGWPGGWRWWRWPSGTWFLRWWRIRHHGAHLIRTEPDEGQEGRRSNRGEKVSWPTCNTCDSGPTQNCRWARTILRSALALHNAPSCRSSSVQHPYLFL